MKRSGFRRVTTVVAAFVLGGCTAGSIDLPPFEFLADPVRSEVDAVVFLVGDAGDALPGQSPLLAELTDQVEEWSRALQRDSAVSVMYLGDIIYPEGLRDPGHPDRPADSLRLWAQIDVVSGPAARAFNSFAWFLPGNHDWGQASGDAGIRRIMNLDSAFVRARESDYKVSLVPPAASPGPVVRDLRRNFRLVALDTHWFLQERAPQAKDAFFERITEALVEAGDREVIFMAHHPFRSAGPHGALVSTTRALGVLFLFKKAGTLIQDLNSPIYNEFLLRLDRAIAAAGRPPLIFAGGHDHSLQVLNSRGGENEPRFALVSGAGSKVSSIQQVPELAYAAARPGFMVLVIRADESVDLYVHGGDPAYLLCNQPEEDPWRACMDAGREAFEVIYSARLREGAPLPPAEVIEEIVAPAAEEAPAPAVPGASVPTSERQP